MLVHELTADMQCPCGSKKKYGACCIRIEPHIQIPDAETADGVSVPLFVVYRGDGTAAIVMPKKTFIFFVHPHMPMVALDDWLCGNCDTMPAELVQPWESLQKHRAKYAQGHPTLVTDGRSPGIKCIGTCHDTLRSIMEHIRFPGSG